MSHLGRRGRLLLTSALLLGPFLQSALADGFGPLQVPLATSTVPGVATLGAASGAASYSDPRLGNVTTRAPTPTDDSTKGYAAGAIWNSTAGLFVAKQVTTGKATWVQQTTGGYPVDMVGGAVPVAVYGTRKLRSAYTGAALNVVRASDSTASDIGFVAGGALDVNALDAFCALTTCTVAIWYDQSGAGNNATQSTAANQPSIASVSLTGNARSVIFDAQINSAPLTQKFMVLPAGVTTQTLNDSMFAVGRAYSSLRPAVFLQISNSTNGSPPQVLSSGTGSAGLTLSSVFNYTAGVGVSQSPTIFGATQSSSATTVYNGPIIATNGVFANYTMAGGFLGEGVVSGSTYTGYTEESAVIIYARTLSATEVANLQASLAYALGLTPQVTDNFVEYGDSITEGYGSTRLLNRPRQSVALFSKPMSVYNFGYFGIMLSVLNANWSTTIPAGLYNPLATNNILEIFAGTNDNDGSNTACTGAGSISANMTALVAKAHTVGWKVVVGTMLPRTAWSTSQTNEAVACNALFKTTSGADAIADYAADPTMGLQGTTTNTSYYLDGTHPTSLGYGYLAPIEAAAVNSLLH